VVEFLSSEALEGDL
jgi:hypothetical protein